MGEQVSRHIALPGTDETHLIISDAYSDMMHALRACQLAARTDGQFWSALEYNFGSGITSAYLTFLQEVDPE